MDTKDLAKHNLKMVHEYAKLKNEDDKIEQAVMGIIYDLSDRRGLSHEWSMIDEEIREEIKAVWMETIREALAS